ncbi:hypothetical protein [Luteibacter yeojuensis]|uniref:DUF4304 domain-containing protein n=1 Tax=Luteibacter yeojuensis TaxID=345309 RepID=A0A7X5QRJ1_9GAMM|nr:hypothetical protein [Luteibacter yeojuensis]NID14108.1 hypothetical protein [Luteibacter yeojuensis]
MDKAAFESFFDEVVSRPLLGRGFVRCGKSLFAEIHGVQIGWVRGGGRFASSGSVAHCVCFRHAFLRDKESRIPVKPPGFPEQYPWVFDLELLPASTHKDWRFDAARLMNLPYGQYTFEGLAGATVRDDLNSRLAAFLRYADWALSLTASDAVAQLRGFAEDYWIARHWLEDYAGRADTPI